MSNIVHLCGHNKPAIGNCFTRMEKRQFEDWYPPPHPPCPLLPGEKQVLLVLPLQLLYHKLLKTNHSNSGFWIVSGVHFSLKSPLGVKNTYLPIHILNQVAWKCCFLFTPSCIGLWHCIALRMMSSVQCHLMLDHFDSQFYEMSTRVPMQHW